MLGFARRWQRSRSRAEGPSMLPPWPSSERTSLAALKAIAAWRLPRPSKRHGRQARLIGPFLAFMSQARGLVERFRVAWVASFPWLLSGVPRYGLGALLLGRLLEGRGAAATAGWFGCSGDA
eukprot:GHVT01024398.1.p2 GENE.GHVT01024398.1~~GHVT01024398.1.p2  ORF type:complete len:122 (+),score=14.00 GHVT01024398.1:286-651(+)